MENFIPLSTKMTEKLLHEDYENADDFDKIAVGMKCFYFNRFARVEYLPLADITAVYRSVGGINPNQCCNTVFDVYMLVVEYGNKMAESKIPYEEQLLEILRYLQKKLPNISIDAE